MELRETVDLMLSPSYKERFVAEYLQAKERYLRLKRYCNKIEAAEMQGATPPPHDCPLELLRRQQRALGEYLHCLEVRAEIEQIDFSVPKDNLLLNAIKSQGRLKDAFIDWLQTTDFKYIAYDPDGSLFLYTVKPTRYSDGYYSTGNDDEMVDISIFSGMFNLKDLTEIKDLKGK